MYKSFDNCILSKDGKELFYCRESSIPSGIEIIGPNAFNSNRTSLTVPDSVITIKEHAFDSCKELTDVEIPASVLTIDNSAFARCNNLSI